MRHHLGNAIDMSLIWADEVVNEMQSRRLVEEPMICRRSTDSAAHLEASTANTLEMEKKSPASC